MRKIEKVSEMQNFELSPCEMNKKENDTTEADCSIEDSSVNNKSMIFLMNGFYCHNTPPSYLSP